MKDHQSLFPFYAARERFEKGQHATKIYLDSAATCLTPLKVAQDVNHYQCFQHANSGRGFYQLSASASEKVEQARQQVANFIGANSADEICFTQSATHSIHNVALGYLTPLLESIDNNDTYNIVISRAEHHANFLPWQHLAQNYHLKLHIVELEPSGVIDVQQLASVVNEQTLLVALSHISNVLGQVNNVATLTKIVRKQSKAKVLIDGAQSVAHIPVDVRQFDCDFFVFSAHKMYGIYGCGILFVKQELIDALAPVQLGGGIVERVTENKTIYAKGLKKLESGSLNLAAITGLSSAIEFINDIGFNEIRRHQIELTRFLLAQLEGLAFVVPIIDECYFAGKSPNDSSNIGIISFTVNGVHSHDIASFLDQQGIAVRAGQHCAQPLHQKLKNKHSVRVSLGLYNTKAELEVLVKELRSAYQLLAIE